MPIPTNLITGFLGVGKTTAIGRLLEKRPPSERWAVLVNEFGQVGVDDMLLDAEGVAIRQVPGGCLCCVSSQAFTVGLNRLIRHERPDRILIEPSGLGHPARIIESLSGDAYGGVLTLNATITLMDARHLASERHRSHGTWIDQIRLADVLVATKADLYTEDERSAFLDFARTLPRPKPLLALVTQGALDPDWLNLPRDPGRLARCISAHAPPDAHHHADRNEPHHADSATFWQVAESRSDGYIGSSWLFAAGTRFREDALRDLLTGLDCERVKALLPTDAGWLRCNRAAREGECVSCKAPADGRGRLEIADPAGVHIPRLERQLREALIRTARE